MNTRRVAAALDMLAQIGRGRRMTPDDATKGIGAVARWDEAAAMKYVDDLQLVMRVPDANEVPADRHWTITSGRSHCSCSFDDPWRPYVVRVEDRSNQTSSAATVGCLALDLTRLVDRGFAELEGERHRDAQGRARLGRLRLRRGPWRTLVLGRPVGRRGP